MSANAGILGLSGSLAIKKIGAKKAPLSWRLKNTLTARFISAWAWMVAARWFTKLSGVPTMVNELSVRVFRPGVGWVDYGVVSRKKITTAGVGLLVDDWQAGTPRINDFKYAGCGTGAVGESNGDTALGAECTTALNPDSTRATCTMTQPSANVVQAQGTLTFDAAGPTAVTEHGILNQAATGGGVLWDRHVFAAINVYSGDSIQFTYQVTVNAEA